MLKGTALGGCPFCFCGAYKDAPFHSKGCRACIRQGFRLIDYIRAGLESSILD